MPLDDLDIDRIADKVEIKLLKGLQEHREKDHAPLEKRVDSMRGKLASHKYVAAGSAAISSAITTLGAMFMGNHK